MIELQLGTGDDRGYYRASVSFTGTSEPVQIRSFHQNVSVTVAPESGTARVEFTMDSVAEIMAETAQWLTWPLGDVSEPADDALLGTATAVRGNATGNCRIKVIAR